jgi:signal transduction histidine kinase
VHADGSARALEPGAKQSFAAILLAYDPDDDEALDGFVTTQFNDVHDGAIPTPIICVIQDGDHRATAQIFGRTSIGFISVEQLRSAYAATMLAAVIERLSHEALLQGAQQQLVHAEKFAAMGILAAEIAHEINNPASFVISNLSVMIEYVRSIGEYLALMHENVRTRAPQLSDDLARLSTDYEINFLQEDLDELLRRSLNGMQRIHQIVQDLRFFSHDADGEPGWINIERMLETTLSLVKYEAKFRAHFNLDFCGDSEIFSDANRLSQVFLNILVNAIHSIEAGAADKNRIGVTTRREERSVVVTISDTGSGIDPEVMQRIFEPFYTTKQRGEGSGLGLSISRDIVQSLGGQISVTSAVGEGSSFVIRLPVRAAKFERDEQLRDSGNFTAAPPADSPIKTTHGPDEPAKEDP